MSPAQAEKVVFAMKAGDSLVYHVGDLQFDRRPDANLDRLGKFMLAAGVEPGFQFCEHDDPIPGLGLGELTQLKVGPNVSEYIFTKS